MFFEHKKENQDDDGRTLLLTQLIDAIYEDMPDGERQVLIVAKRQLEANVYLPQVIDDLRAGLRRYAIKNELTPTTKKIFDESIDRKYQYSTTGMGIAMVFGTMLGGGH